MTLQAQHDPFTLLSSRLEREIRYLERELGDFSCPVSPTTFVERVELWQRLARIHLRGDSPELQSLVAKLHLIAGERRVSGALEELSIGLLDVQLRSFPRTGSGQAGLRHVSR